MKSIDYKELMKSDLHKSGYNTFADFYYKQNKFYKIFTKCLKYNLVDTYRRLNILGEIKDLDIAVLPEELVESCANFKLSLRGYGMRLLNPSVSLHDLSEMPNRVKQYFSALESASKGMQQLHERPEDIIISDANFTNVHFEYNDIGIDMHPNFIDFDSVQVGGIESLYFPILTKNYYDSREEEYITSRNNDRLSYLIEFLNSLGFILSSGINMYQFDSYAEVLETFRNLRELVVRLSDYSKPVPDIPYMHEVIDLADAEILERDAKSLSLK